jgi:ParB family transcriptional regulator, chromosome partitioning protein
MSERFPGTMDIPLDAIVTGNDRLRPAYAAGVAKIADSIIKTGAQFQAVLVRPLGDDRYQLVDGLHRVEAMRSLGASTVRAEIRDLSDAEARLAEVEANIYRQDLSPLDRALFLVRRRAIYEEMYPELLKKGGDRKSLSYRKAFEKIKGARSEIDRMHVSNELRAEINLSEKHIKRLLQFGSRLQPETIDLIRKSPISDNLTQLIALSKMPADEQVLVARAAADQGLKTLATAKERAGLTIAPEKRDPQELALARILKELPALGAKGLDAVIAAAQTALKAKSRMVKSQPESQSGDAA